MGSRRGRNEGSIFQRTSDGRWVASISYRDENGKLHRPRRYARTRAEARDLLRTMQRQAEQGANMASKPPTLEKFLNDWLEASKASVRPRTSQGYRSIVDVRIVPYIGKLRVDKVTPAVLQRLYAQLGGSGLSAQSVINAHRVLHRAFAQGMRWGALTRNPADAVDVPRTERPEMVVMTRAQVGAFLDATRDHRDHALYVVAVTSGMRQGELLGLRWSDLDLDAGRLTIQRSLQRQKGLGYVFSEPKTSSSRRTVMLSKQAVAALRSHRARQAAERLALGPEWTDQGLVFPNTTGGPKDAGTTTATFQQALERAGLPKMRFHALRHTAATLLLEADVHPKVVSEMLGHSSITLTLQTYSHVNPTMHALAADTMDRLLG